MELMMKKKVFWTQAETRLMAEMVIKTKLDPSEYGFIAKVNKLQDDVLPPTRHKFIKSTDTVKGLLAALRELSPPPVVEEPPATPPEVETEAEVLPPQAPPEPPVVKDLGLEDIIKLFAVKVGEALLTSLTEHIQQSVKQQLLALLPKDPLVFGGPVTETRTVVEKVRPPERTRLPRVVIVGLINQQAADVEHAFDGRIDFVFVKSQQSGGGGGHGMLAKSDKADVVIAITKFIGHDVEHSAKKLNAPFVRLNGGVSGLKRWLTSWLEGSIKLSVNSLQDLGNLKPVGK
jgi:hypothetical protein